MLSDEQQMKQIIRCRVPPMTNPFTFKHGGRGYWIVEGPVPVEVAWTIYNDPASQFIRVAGHCLAPAPVDPWTKWIMPDGTTLLTNKDKAELDNTAALSDPVFHADYMKGFTFSDDPELRRLAKCYVTMYHIDTELGLRVFVDYLKWFKLL